MWFRSLGSANLQRRAFARSPKARTQKHWQSAHALRQLRIVVVVPVISITFPLLRRPFVGEFLPLVGRTLARLTAEAYSGSK